MRYYHIKKQHGGPAFETIAFFHGDDEAFQKRFCELSDANGHRLVAEVSDIPFAEAEPESIEAETPKPVKVRRNKAASE